MAKVSGGSPLTPPGEENTKGVLFMQILFSPLQPLTVMIYFILLFYTGGPSAGARSLAANGDGGQGVSGGGASAAAAAPGAAPRQSNRSNRGVPPIRFIEMYLAAAAKQEAK